MNKAVQQGNKAGVWSWDITDWLAPLSGSVRAAEQDSGCEGTLGVEWAFLAVCLSVCPSVSCQFVCIPLIVFTHTHLLFLHISARPQTHLFVFCSSFLSSFSLSPFASSYLLFPFSYSPLTTVIMLHPPPPPRLMSSFTPPLHPSNVGGQQNNNQGVMATDNPLPAVSSCYCPWSYCCLAPALY